MIKYNLLCLFFFGMTIIANGQTQGLEIFEPLMGKIWKAEEEWDNGGKFKQEVTFRYDLQQKLVLTNSKGYTNKEQSEYGPRNVGIRQWDEKSGKVQFWEYDVFGGITQGVVFAKGKDLFYQYQYGDYFLTDHWAYVNDSTYNFKVGVMEKENWAQVFLSTQFNAQPANMSTEAAIAKHLVGNWSAKAWDGVLEENWTLGNDGHLHQSAQYLENGEILYEAQNRMEWVGNTLILFTVIKGNNPKIFKATSISDQGIRFENSEYKNPSVVIYEFLDQGFRRTIRGVEKGEPSETIFEFERKKP